MVALAAILDLVQFLLDLTVLASIVSMFIGGLAFIIFGLWFWLILREAKYKGKSGLMKIITAVGTLGIEIPPIIDGLPGITAGVVAMIIQSRIDDRAHAAERATMEKIEQQKLQELRRIQATVRARQIRDAQAGHDNEQSEGDLMPA